MVLKAAQIEKRKSPGYFLGAFLSLVVILSLLFFRSFLPGYTVFSNDGPLGNLVSQPHRLPEGFTGGWQDLNSIGFREGGAFPNLSFGLMWLLGPVGFSKFYAPIALLVLGLGAWCFFRRLGLAPLACVLGGLAATLNSGFFSAACWGVAAHPITIGMSYFALAALVEVNPRRQWLNAGVAGLAIGIAVAEGADIGAIFSLYVAAFAVYHSFIGEGPALKKAISGIGRVAVVALLAALVAAQSISALVGTQIKGVAGAQQDTRSKEDRWDWATQWSLPKAEALGLIIPGLFGYRMDTPGGGNYWGAVGRDAAWDRYFAGGKQGPAPLSFMRFTGGGNYAGIPVVLIALWAALQALRKDKSVFSVTQRRYLWFWMVVAAGSLLLAFGRFAPFYSLLYTLPYFSTIRNPAKFTHVVNWALVVLFAYGLHGLSRRYLEGVTAAANGLSAHVKNWLAKATGFEKKWTMGCIAALAASLLGWLLYASSRADLEKHLQEAGFPDQSMAAQIAGFSFREIGVYILFLVLGVALLTVILSGWFAGKRSRLAGILLGLLLVVDLGRANLPWIRYVDYKDKYATNGVIDLLREKPYEHRVAILPFRTPPPLALLDEVYRIEWAQHHFQYYNIQSLDIVQMPRMPEDLVAFETALGFDGTSNTMHRITRRLELTNTRYLLGASGFLSLLNQQIDPLQRRFRIAAAFDLVAKPGVLNPSKPGDLTTVIKPDGQYALFDFAGALPRAKLYTDWQVSTNDNATLERLASPGFDPARTVLVAAPLPVSAAGGAKQAGAVDFVSYAPKRIVLRAKADAPSVLLLSDRFDPNWRALVDGKAQTLLRCNYIMRGVQLPAGEHQIEFRFTPPVSALYVSLMALGLGLGLVGFVAFSKPAEAIALNPSSQAARVL